MTEWQLAERKKIDAHRAGDVVLLVAEGDNPTPGFEVTILESPLRIFPPQYQLLRRARPGIFPQHITPYLHAELVRYPADQTSIRVQHAEGTDEVEIQPCGPELAGLVQALVPASGGAAAGGADPATEATGTSASLSFDEAFSDALTGLLGAPPPHPDALTTVQVTEIGGLFGGIAGLHHLYVRVKSSTD